MSSGTPTTSKTSDKETDTVKRDSEDLDPLDDNCCSICIDEIKEMCYTDTCLHRFCFSCLSEWVKRKHICPMCKADFTSIIHNIKSDEDYEITPLFPEMLATSLAEEEENMISEDERQARQLQLLELGDLREDIMWLNLDASSQSPEVQQVRSEITENLVSAIDEVGRILDRL